MKLTKRVVLQGLVGALVVGAAHADAKWYDAVTASGYLQGSYVGSLNRPTSAAGAKQSNTGRQFDTESNGFTLNTFLLQIAKPVADDKFGFTARLRTGQDASVLAGNTSQFFVQEAYATYAATSKLSVIGGRFVTPLGYEVVDTVANPNFSEGLLFTYAEPVGHTGVKANYVFSDKLNATVGVVNGWDMPTGDNNTAKTILWQVATTPMKGFAWYFQGLYGKETADPSNTERLALDTVATLALSDKLSLAAQAIWAEQTGDAANAKQHWSGLGAWVTFAETAKTSTSLRFEILADENSANRFGATAANFSAGEAKQTVKEITVTQKYMLTSNMGVRGEYRHDWSNEPYYAKSAENAAVRLSRVQNTISADWFVTF